MKKIKGKILTIDDESDFSGIIKNYFSLRGYEVFSAIRGTAGIEIATKESPDIVFVDLKLPGIDGDQILSQIRKLTPKAKVIMITAFKDEGQTKDRVLKAGAYAYFEKPISSFKGLEETVSKAIEEGG